jgi:hypothetical protein
MSEETITAADIEAASDWAFQLGSKIVIGNHGCGNAAVLIDRALEARAKAAEAENARLVAFVQRFAIQPCSCGVMQGAVICVPCRARAVIEENQIDEIRSLREQVAKERAGIVAFVRGYAFHVDDADDNDTIWCDKLADAIEAQQDKEPT